VIINGKIYKPIKFILKVRKMADKDGLIYATFVRKLGGRIKLESFGRHISENHIPLPKGIEKLLALMPDEILIRDGITGPELRYVKISDSAYFDVRGDQFNNPAGCHKVVCREFKYKYEGIVPKINSTK
jgi:hypothetical protein